MQDSKDFSTALAMLVAGIESISKEKTKEELAEILEIIQEANDKGKVVELLDQALWIYKDRSDLGSSDLVLAFNDARFDVLLDPDDVDYVLTTQINVMKNIKIADVLFGIILTLIAIIGVLGIVTFVNLISM